METEWKEEAGRQDGRWLSGWAGLAQVGSGGLSRAQQLARGQTQAAGVDEGANTCSAAVQSVLARGA